MSEDVFRYGQHRLARVQLFNWGTYDGYHDLPVARRGFLITGPSGSGKSTLLDAISTVLVPPTKLSFNAAAQGRGRSVASYVRGAYARGSDTETRELRSRYLREGATWSAVGLTMTTADPEADTVTTLVALFHLKRGSNDLGESGRAFLLFDHHVDITELRHVVTDGIDVRGLKKRWPEVLYNKSYPQFGQRLRARLGIADENAQLLLHRAMSAKGLDSLDRLFRDYMLDEPDTFAEARRAVEFFADLDEAHRRVVQTREQIAALTPLEGLTETRDREAQQTQELGDEQAALDGLAARFEVHLAQGWNSDAAAALTDAVTRDEQAAAVRQRAATTLKDAERARDGNQSLREVTDALEKADEQVRRVVTQRGRMAVSLQAWNTAVPDTAEGFATMCSQIAREAAELEAGSGTHETAHSATILAAARADDLVTDLKQQISALAGQKSNLDPKLLVARSLVMRATGLPAANIALSYVATRDAFGLRGKMDKCTFCAGGPEKDHSKAEVEKYGRNRLAEGKLPATFEQLKEGGCNPLGVAAKIVLARADEDERIAREFEHLPWIAATIFEYEQLASEEARYVKIFDKVLPKLTHLLNGGAALREHGFSYEKAHADHLRQRAQMAREYPQADALAVFDAIVTTCAQQWGIDEGVIFGGAALETTPR